MLKIAIQGGLGSFHHIVAQHYFKQQPIDLVECESFPVLFQTLENKQADMAIMAIENVIAGSILQNYNLLRTSELSVYGELFLRIKHNLMTLPGQLISEINEVYSHPMAIMQCRHFFRQYPHIKLIEADDTALSAKRIKDGHLKKTGAIASDLAAEIYQLELMAESIETVKKNQTRFLVIAPKNLFTNIKTNINKASICFELKHKKGSLSQILSVLAFYDINLTKIQSMPIMETEWEYTFFVDLTFEDYDRYQQAIAAIEPLLSTLDIMGEYAQGEFFR